MVACHMHVVHSALASLMITIKLCLLRTYYNQLGSQPLLTARCAVVQRRATPPRWAACVCAVERRTLKTVTLGVRTRAARCR